MEHVVVAEARGIGVGRRLLLAFLGISGFAVLAAAAAMYAFWTNRAAFEQVTEQRVPAALNSLELSRQSERIVAAAPSLLTVKSTEQHRELSSKIQQEVDSLDGLIANLGSGTGGRYERDSTADYAQLNRAVSEIRHNLRSLDRLLEQRLIIADKKSLLADKLIQTHAATDRLLAPWLQATEAIIVRAQHDISDSNQSQLQQSAAALELASAVTTFRALQEVQATTASINDILFQAESMQLYEKLNIMIFRLKRLLDQVGKLNKELHPKLQTLLEKQLEQYSKLALGNSSIPGTRQEELDLLISAEKLISDNAELSEELTNGVDSHVSEAKEEIDQARQKAAFVQSVSISVLLGVVGLSLLSSVLIVWRYVSRNLVRRLGSLSDSMLSIANGNLSVQISEEGNDEIADMARALKVFRDTAIEVRETNLREIQEARRRLSDAIESISEGFALFDADDCLIVRNQRFVELFPGLEEIVVEGVAFEDIVRSAEYKGLLGDNRKQAEKRIADRLSHHRNPGTPFLQYYSNGRWIQINERETGSEGTVAVYTDVTDVKRHEEIAHQAKEQAEKALEELQRAQNSLVQAEKLAQLGQLVAGIAHELKNPLNFVKNFAEVSEELIEELQTLLNELSIQADQNRDSAVDELLYTLVSNLKKIKEHGMRADSIIRSMLAHSRGGTSDWQIVDINRLVQESINLAYHGARATDGTSDVALESSLDDNLGDIEVIPQDISRVLLNLLGNSFDAVAKRATASGNTGYTAQIMISTRELGDSIQISVRDNGDGISPEIQEKMFTPFYTTKAAGKGTGLGLSLSNDIVTHEHSGEIAVESRPGEYTEITITLPRVQHQGVARTTTHDVAHGDTLTDS